jgi:hypothetical protein
MQTRLAEILKALADADEFMENSPNPIRIQMSVSSVIEIVGDLTRELESALNHIAELEKAVTR